MSRFWPNTRTSPTARDRDKPADKLAAQLTAAVELFGVDDIRAALREARDNTKEATR